MTNDELRREMAAYMTGQKGMVFLETTPMGAHDDPVLALYLAVVADEIERGRQEQRKRRFCVIRGGKA